MGSHLHVFPLYPRSPPTPTGSSLLRIYFAGADFIEVPGNRLRYEFYAPVNRDGGSAGAASASPTVDGRSPNAGLLWGIALVVAPVAYAQFPGTGAARPSELARLARGSEVPWRGIEGGVLLANSSSPAVAPRSELEGADGACMSDAAAVPPPSDSPSAPAMSPSQLAALLARVPYEVDCLLVQWVNIHSAHGTGADEDDRAGGSRRMVSRALDIRAAGKCTRILQGDSWDVSTYPTTLSVQICVSAVRNRLFRLAGSLLYLLPCSMVD
jgi:hypothetical protein